MTIKAMMGTGRVIWVLSTFVTKWKFLLKTETLKAFVKSIQVSTIFTGVLTWAQAYCFNPYLNNGTLITVMGKIMEMIWSVLSFPVYLRAERQKYRAKTVGVNISDH